MSQWWRGAVGSTGGARERERRRRRRPAVLLAAGTSCAVVSANALGALNGPVVVVALGAAGVIAVLGIRGGRPRAHALAPLGDEWSPVVVAAPRASDLVARPIDSVDVA